MALASATPPTQPGPTLILRAKPFLAGPPNRHRPASPQLWTAPQPHGPRSLSLLLPPLSVPHLLSARAYSHSDPDPTPPPPGLPFFSRPLPPALFLAQLAPLWPRPPGSGPAPSPFPLGRPKSLVRAPPRSLQHPSPSPGPAPSCSGPALSPRPPAAPPPCGLYL